MTVVASTFIQICVHRGASFQPLNFKAVYRKLGLPAYIVNGETQCSGYIFAKGLSPDLPTLCSGLFECRRGYVGDYACVIIT